MADNSTTNVFWWLLGHFWGPLAIKEDIFGLFGPFLVFRELKSEQKQPFYASLKSNSTILDPIMSQCGLEMHKLLSKYIWIWLQIGVKWLFLVWFEVSKDPKRPNLSSFIARDPQNFPSSHKKIFLGGINSIYKSVGSISTVLAVPANLAQYESVQRWFIPSGWANLSFSKAEVTATEV